MAGRFRISPLSIHTPSFPAQVSFSFGFDFSWRSPDAFNTFLAYHLLVYTPSPTYGKKIIIGIQETLNPLPTKNTIFVFIQPLDDANGSKSERDAGQCQSSDRVLARGGMDRWSDLRSLLAVVSDSASSSAFASPTLHCAFPRPRLFLFHDF
jgi:hypothetical protein